MYGKLFSQMYDGTLATKGPWQALITFQQLIILADKHGVVDMTPEAIARRTTIPLKIIQDGITRLLEADPDSRSPNEEGRRITQLSDSRTWGWQIVNYEHYRNLRSTDERREYHRQYYHKIRKNKADSTISTNSTISTDSTKAVSSKQYAVSKETKTARKARSVSIPEDFGNPFTPAMQAWLDKRGETQTKAHLIHFIGYIKANGKQYVDWDAAFQNAIRDDWAGIRKAMA